MSNLAPMSADPVRASARATWQNGQPMPGDWAAPGPALTLAMQLTVPAGPGALVCWRNPPDRIATQLAVSNSGGQPVLQFELGFEGADAPLNLCAPLAPLDAGQPHAVVLRHLGHRIELWVDGVLLDEEWPLHRRLAFAGPPQVLDPGARELLLWDRAIRDEELLGLSGGSVGIDARAERYLGANIPPGQYWRPRGHNVHFGDALPFFHAGRFHLYYLRDRRNGRSAWGCGAHQWAHASTTDLRHWEEHPLAVPLDGKLAGSICTGSVFFHDGVFHAFYTERTSDRSPAPLSVATSTDGINFTKHPPLFQLPPPYDAYAGRDPVVFRDEANRQFHLLLTTALLEPAGARGCLAHLTSADLRHWELREPFFFPGGADHPECPDYFSWHGWYYLIFSIRGIARYRMSRQPFGPWLAPTVDTFDGPQAFVLKTAAFTGDRRLGVAFLPAGGYAGDAVFRELVQHADGTLGTKWPAELVPALGAATAWPLEANTRAPSRTLPHPPRDFRLRARVCPGNASADFGVRLGAAGAPGTVEVRFTPDRGTVSFCAVGDQPVELSAVSGLDRPFEFQFLARCEILDLCVDDRRTLVARFPERAAQPESLTLFGSATWEALELSRLSGAPA